MELSLKVREIINTLEEALEVENWEYIEDSIELMNNLYDDIETQYDNYEIDIN